MEILKSRLQELENVLPFAEPCLDLNTYYSNHGVLLGNIYNQVCQQYAMKLRRDADEFCSYISTDGRHQRSAKYGHESVRNERKRQQDRKASLKKRLLKKAEKISVLNKIVLVSKLLKNHRERWKVEKTNIENCIKLFYFSSWLNNITIFIIQFKIRTEIST